MIQQNWARPKMKYLKRLNYLELGQKERMNLLAQYSEFGQKPKFISLIIVYFF